MPYGELDEGEVVLIVQILILRIFLKLFKSRNLRH